MGGQQEALACWVEGAGAWGLGRLLVLGGGGRGWARAGRLGRLPGAGGGWLGLVRAGGLGGGLGA